MICTLSDLYNSTFYFCLKKEFRDHIFTKLKNKYLTWVIVSKQLGIDTRTLFSIRRGWEIRDNKKKEYMINSKLILRIKNKLNLEEREIENNISKIKYGTSGVSGKINLPTELNKEDINLYSVEGALLDYLTIKNIEESLKKDHPSTLSRINKYFAIFPKLTQRYIKKLKRQGLKPKAREDNNFIYLSYRIPGTNIRKEVIIPKKIVFNEEFSKQFGKWIGDRCGGIRKIGVANKERLFVEEFSRFLKEKLNQKAVIYLTCKPTFKIPKKISSKTEYTEYHKTQFGDYAYRTETSNAPLKNLVFDNFENNLFQILYHSPKSVRFAFYAGLFEAEGSISRDSKIISFSFGLNLKTETSKQEITKLYKKAIELNYLLKNDGFYSRISRKIAKTKNSNVLKYDIALLNSKETRNQEVSFIKGTFLPYITHKIKLNTFKEVFDK